MASIVALMLLCHIAMTIVTPQSAWGSSADTAPSPTEGIDDTALANFLSSVPDGSTIDFPVGAVYQLDRTLQIVRRLDLMIDGHGATFQWVTASNQNRRHIRLLEGGNIVIQNLTVRGANPHAGLWTAAWESHLRLAACVHVQCGSRAFRRHSDRQLDLRPERTLGHLGRLGERILIRSNTAADVRMAVIDLEPMTRDCG